MRDSADLDQAGSIAEFLLEQSPVGGRRTDVVETVDDQHQCPAGGPPIHDAAALPIRGPLPAARRPCYGSQV
ncbi:MAG: hypothetical protein DMG07_03355 [Acidobacteria bacterium]|nr:MAG: hypothetical protein DMG07_03355 [Acidobacteriota bacterium]